MGTYSITSADITPDRIPSDEYAELLKRPSTGAADETIENVITLAEEEFTGQVGGTLTTAAHLALAKPFCILVVLYRMHTRRAANGDYKVPESVKDDWKAAIAWATGTGAKLLAAEGTVQVPGQDQVEYDADDAEYGMTQTDRL